MNFFTISFIVLSFVHYRGLTFHFTNKVRMRIVTSHRAWERTVSPLLQVYWSVYDTIIYYPIFQQIFIGHPSQAGQLLHFGYVEGASLKDYNLVHWEEITILEKIR